MIGWTSREMLAVAASRLLHDGDVALVGLGLPQVAGLLARRTHAPSAVLLLEVGVFEPAPTDSAMGIADPALWEGSTSYGGMLDVLGAMLHGGRVSVGLLGALQVDTGGSVNSTAVFDGEGMRRFGGSGGANDIASLARRMIVVMQHHPWKFRQTVDFLTSPGRVVRGRPRHELGLTGEGTSAVITDRAVIHVVDEGLVLRSVHPGETAEAVRADTPVALSEPSEGVAVTPEPTDEELQLIRTELDPHGWYTS